MVSVNLLPLGILAARRRNERVRLWLSVGAVAAVLTAVPLTLDLTKTAAAASFEARLAPLQARLETVRAELRKTATESEEITAQLGRADALRGKRSWSALLAMITAKAPDTVWFTALRTPGIAPQRTGPAATSGTAAQPQSVTLGGPGGIHLEGYALDHEALYAFMSSLKDTQVFVRVELTAAGKEPVLTGTAVRFVLECYW